jgi:nucleoside-diphosphate-sugar epimerase
MLVLVVGGAGYVAGLVLPVLAERHTIRILDRRPPHDGTEHMVGEATDYDVLRTAMDGVDAVVHCAMGVHATTTPAGAADAFDVNVKSVHLTLRAMHDAGVPHAVHVSSLSVFSDITQRSLDESVPPDATDVYGLTKRLGEQVCEAAVREWGLSVNVLRLAWPTPDDVWPAWGVDEPPCLRYAADGTPMQATAGTDVGHALVAALDHRAGFGVFTISGDGSAGHDGSDGSDTSNGSDGPVQRWSTAKAQRVLGWQPTFGRQVR